MNSITKLWLCLISTVTIVVYFDGLNPPYREDDPVSPVSLYGEQKALVKAIYG